MNLIRSLTLILFTLNLALLSNPTSAGSALPNCPELSLSETKIDCPWAGITRAILAGERDGISALPFLLKHAPEAIRDIKVDSKKKYLIELWGESINYDEFAKARIIEASILKALYRFFFGKILEQVEEKQVVHAGLEHTYGYLFSNLKTPFGYKRARWVSGDIEKGFGLSVGTFGPTPQAGTLLGNISYFAGSVAMRNDAATIARVNEMKSDIPEELSKFKFGKLKITRIEEAVKIGNHLISLRTDLVRFSKGKVTNGNSHLLIYSVFDSSKGHPTLITAFPVQNDFVVKKTDLKTMGDQVEITTQYNAFVPGLTGQKIAGSRKILESTP